MKKYHYKMLQIKNKYWFCESDISVILSKESIKLCQRGRQFHFQVNPFFLSLKNIRSGGEDSAADNVSGAVAPAERVAVS